MSLLVPHLNGWAPKTIPGYREPPTESQGQEGRTAATVPMTALVAAPGWLSNMLLSLSPFEAADDSR